MSLRPRVAASTGAVFLLLSLLISAVSAAEAIPPGAQTNPREFVRRAVTNELNSNTTQHFTYRLQNVKPNRTEVRQVLETDAAILARTLMVNGEPLTKDQAAKEDRRLDRLNDPDELASKIKDQREEEGRIRKMLGALPDAFLYQYSGMRAGQHGQVVVLNFKPDPAFDPPSRETQVYRGMEGVLEIGVPDMRLASIKANLVEDVTFGWGILGHLDRGGRFEVDQAPVASGTWVTTHMVLNFTGKVLLFKSLNIHQDQTTSDYQPVPNMTVAQGITTLKKMDGEVARTAGRDR